jgi:AMP deaminase
MSHLFPEGEVFPERVKKVMAYLDEQKYLKLELRVSIYGRSTNEWDTLANWFSDYEMKHPHITWMIQVPRLYNIFKKKNVVTSMSDWLRNIFEPVMEASLHPQNKPKLTELLQQVVAFDSVDDESKEPPNSGMLKNSSYHPDEWVNTKNPTYTYYLYYMYANLASINSIRERQNMNIITFRPHCGESGHVTHLAAGYLLADSMAHGIMLKNSPVLQYLYYLTQIGMSISPQSNNSLFLRYEKNPLPKFHQRGLNVTISTDDPLIFHLTKEPLIEEYAIAAQVWRLSQTDLCELARKSVLQSGFSEEEKVKWLGENYCPICPRKNKISKSNVPSVRMAYRAEMLQRHLEGLMDNLRGEK